MYVSHNYGSSFSKLTSAPVSTYSAVSVSSNFAFICAVGDVGMTCSTDAGVTWTNGTTNSVPFNYWQTVFIAGNGDISYAKNSGKVLYSIDNGLTWLAAENFPAQQICHVINCDDTGSQVAVSCYSATALSNDSTIYIGTVGGGSSSDSSLSSGQIAGIVIATVLGAVIIIGGIVGYFMYPILFSPKDPVLPSTVAESPTVVASTS